MQYSLLSLIPLLLSWLDDSGDPKLDNLSTRIKRATSLKSSDRVSLLTYMGLPLQIFSHGMFFGPYTPLQQVDMLENEDTKGYLIGSTNSLFLQRRERHADILVNVIPTPPSSDLDRRRNSRYPPPSTILCPYAHRRRQKMDRLTSNHHNRLLGRKSTNLTTQLILDDKSRPRTMSFIGSEDYIRAQFEEYLLSLLSSVKYNVFLSTQTPNGPLLPDIGPSPSPHR
jgi:Transport protein Avl9